MALQKVLPVTTPPQDPLDIALMQSEKRLEKGNLEILANALKFGATFGQQFEALRQEESALQKELTIKKHYIEVLTTLSKEKRGAHLESARTSMMVIAKNITTLLQTFRDFKTHFPQETISQIPESEIPNNGWLKSMETILADHQTKYPLSLEASPAQPAPVANNLSLVLTTHHSQVARVVEKDHCLQDNVANMKRESQVIEENIVKMRGELQVLEEKEQRIKRYEIQAITSWNETFAPYVKKVILFQDKVKLFLQQQNATLVSLAQESNNFRMAFIRDPYLLVHSPNSIQICQREMSIPGEMEATLNKIKNTPSLLEKIDIIAPLFSAILFKQNDEGKS